MYFILSLVLCTFLYLPSLAKEEFNAHLFNYQQGVSAHKNGDLENAELFLKNSLNMAPLNTPALIELGEVYIEKGDYNSAISILQKALNTNQNDALVHVLLGTAYQEIKKFDTAIFHFGQAIKLEPENTLIRVNIGLACSQKGDNQCTIDNLGKVVLAYPFQLRARTALGTAYHSSKDYALAKDQYKSVLEYEPNNLNLWYNLAKVQIALNEYEDAKISLDKAIEIDSTIADLFLDRASVNYKLNKHEIAEKDYLKALSVDSSNPVTPAEYAVFLWMTGAYSKSAEQFSRAYEMQPDDKSLLSNKAYLYQLSGESENAISAWTDVLKSDAGNTVALFNLGKLYQEKEDYQNSIQYYKKFLSQKSIKKNEVHEVELALAYCYQQNKNIEEAKTLYEKILTESPDDSTSLFNIAILLIEEKKYKESIPYLENAIKNNFDPLKKAYQALTESYLNLNDTSNAKTSYKNWLDLDKDNIEGRISFAKFLAMTGDSLAAIDQYRVAAALDNTSASRFKLAQFLLEQKDLYGALGQFQEYLKLEPNDLNALTLIANTYRDLHINEQAEEYYKKIIALSPENHLAYYNLGLIYQESKKYEEAINYFLKSLEFNEKFAPSYYAIGLSYILNNDKENAKDYFEKYLLVDPAGEYKDKAELKLKEILTPTENTKPEKGQQKV